MHVMKIPVLSTAHITEDADDWLANAHDVWAIVASYEGGHFVSIALYNVEMLSELPAKLVDVLKWAKKNKHDWIRLDRDGDIVPKLPQYEW